MKTPTARSRRVANALRLYAKHSLPWTRWAESPTKMTHAHANEFIIISMFNQGVPWERAWQAGQITAQAFGNHHHADELWQNIARCKPQRMRLFMKHGFAGGSLHRYWKKFSKWLPIAAEIILDKYNGDPRKIWAKQRNVEVVRSRLLELPGFGTALARMAVLELARGKGLLGGKAARRQLDVKPDVHVVRVFRRTGIVPLTATVPDVILAAQQLAPDFPASLDPAAWEIGMEWCRPKRPACSDCPLHKVCPKKGIA